MNRIFGLLTQWGLRLSLKRMRAPDAMELLATRGVEATWRRSIAEALAPGAWRHVPERRGRGAVA
jgi:hypothetical protein